MIDGKPRILVVEGRFYEALADALLGGAVTALKAAGARYDVLTVPGALEVPAVIALAAASGGQPGGIAYDGYVALGCVIRGETYHFEIVANKSARGLMSLAVSQGLAIGNGILTVDTEAQAWARATDGQDNKGAGAANACLAVIRHKAHLMRPAS